ncbi:MAG TPA: hypothetical protein VFX49_10075 [Chloroflexota bacterium]|nr:hypothetical protein [Chloroflexota bacterium]
MAASLPEQIGAALRDGQFDPQHAGELFLRSDAQKALAAKLAGATIAVNGKDDVRGTGFLGARYAPDLVVEQGGKKVAVTITLLRGDASPVTTALAGALVLSGRYDGVVAFVLDRRLAKRNPFDDPKDEPEQRDLTDAEKSLVRQLSERHGVLLEVRRQDPFGW